MTKITQPTHGYEPHARDRDGGVRREPAAGVKGVDRPAGARFSTIQVCPKDLRALPEHPEPAVSWLGGFRGGPPEPAVSWHSGFRGGAHARPKTTPVHQAAPAQRQRGSSRR